MSLMPGAWALAGRRLPVNGEARHQLVGSSVRPPCPGGGTDADIVNRDTQGYWCPVDRPPWLTHFGNWNVNADYKKHFIFYDAMDQRGLKAMHA